MPALGAALTQVDGATFLGEFDETAGVILAQRQHELDRKVDAAEFSDEPEELPSVLRRGVAQRDHFLCLVEDDHQREGKLGGDFVQRLHQHARLAARGNVVRRLAETKARRRQVQRFHAGDAFDRYRSLGKPEDVLGNAAKGIGPAPYEQRRAFGVAQEEVAESALFQAGDEARAQERRLATAGVPMQQQDSCFRGREALDAGIHVPVAPREQQAILDAVERETLVRFLRPGVGTTARGSLVRRCHGLPTGATQDACSGGAGFSIR